MSWEMQVEVRHQVKGRLVKEWRSVKPDDNRPPYRYPTETQARNMLRICYGSVVSEEIRVVEVNRPSNIGLER